VNQACERKSAFSRWFERRLASEGERERKRDSQYVVATLSQDRRGEYIQPLLDTPCLPAWGSSFASKGFYWALWNAWKKQPSAKTILVFVAGNDLFAGANPDKVVEEMDGLQHYYHQHGVRVTYINVVPRAFHVF
jgi:hypothetical protein